MYSSIASEVLPRFMISSIASQSVRYILEMVSVHLVVLLFRIILVLFSGIKIRFKTVVIV
jgi:hypothetical protein